MWSGFQVTILVSTYKKLISNNVNGIKMKINKVNVLVSNTATLASTKFKHVRNLANETRKNIISHTKTFDIKNLSDRFVDKVKDVDKNHKEVADKVETVSMGLGITSGIVVAGASLAAPTGLSAAAVAIGITSAPMIVAAAPIITAAATTTGVISGGFYFYSKWKSRREK